MRVLITGARGQVGSELIKRAPAGFEAIGMGSAELNISNRDQVAQAMDKLQPQLIINAAAYTAVDRAESEPKLAYAVNRDGVRCLAQLAERAGIPVLHISTDYVFSGEKDGPYSETDTTDPTGVYGASKLSGERALLEHCSRHLVLRTSWVFGETGNNFVKTMLRLGSEREVLGIVTDQRGGPTPAAAIARALWQITGRYAADPDLPWGLYHFSGAPACNWYEFAITIFEQALKLGLLKRTPRLNAITTADYPTPARRPANSVLDCRKIRQTFGITQPDWPAELLNILNATGSR